VSADRTAAQGVPAAPPRKVETGRGPEADLTQEGAVLGTPLYMPPEQAAGCVLDVDERSDVYSLGAILYELLTLHPPIESEGGYLAILLRVVQGQVVPPEERAPQRVRAGKVPKELSAVARKALAKDPRDRYPTVEALRRDVELYQEGRSVSARQDTAREILWKLVKRNQGASLATALALLVIAVIVGFSIKLINDGRLRAEDAYAAYRQEQEAKRLQAKGSVPVVLEAARFATERRRFREALAQANVAVEYDPEHAGARLFRAKVRIAEKDYPAARADLEKYLELRPGDAHGTRLLELCRKARAEDTRSIAALADAFLAQDEVVLAAHLVETRAGQLALYRQRIDDAWPGAKPGKLLTMDNNGNCALELRGAPEVTDLEPLRGIPLVRLVVEACANLRDLGALHDLPLTVLNIQKCPKVADLTPLAGLKLTALALVNNGAIKDLSPLRDMPLKSLTLSPARESPYRSRELDVLRGMPLTSLTLNSQDVGGLVFVSDLPHLTHLDLQFAWHVGNLASLEDLKLKTLLLVASDVGDLSHLVKVPLEHLDLDSCTQLTNLEPLGKIPTLKWLSITRCPRLKKKLPLAGLQLKTILLDASGYPPEEMEVLRQMKSLEWIATGTQQENHYRPEKFWQKYDAKGFK
jgi:tetratricopeptide (TPR) repeat protein